MYFSATKIHGTNTCIITCAWTWMHECKQVFTWCGRWSRSTECDPMGARLDSRSSPHGPSPCLPPPSPPWRTKKKDCKQKLAAVLWGSEGSAGLHLSYPVCQKSSEPSEPPLANRPSCTGCQATAANREGQSETERLAVGVTAWFWSLVSHLWPPFCALWTPAAPPSGSWCQTACKGDHGMPSTASSHSGSTSPPSLCSCGRG